MTTFSTCTICHSLTLLYPWPLAQAASLQAGPSSARGGEPNTPGDQHSALRGGLEQNGGSTAVLCAMRVWLRSRRLRRLGHSNHLVKRQNPFVADLGFRITAGVLSSFQNESARRGESRPGLSTRSRLEVSLSRGVGRSGQLRDTNSSWLA